MADNPPARLLVAEVRKALEAGLAPGFPQKVAANALGIAQRELENGPAVSAEEATRLSEAIRRGAVDDDLVGELIRISIARLEIDQPGYPPFRAYKEAAGQP